MKARIARAVFRLLRPWIEIKLGRAHLSGWMFRVIIFNEVVVSYQISPEECNAEMRDVLEKERKEAVQFQQAAPPPYPGTWTYGSVGGGLFGGYR